MQFRIRLQVLIPGQLLPLSYQYELSAWIYKLIGQSNSDFGSFLHNQGYVSEGRRFKFFTFSRLHIPQYEILGDRMKIMSSEISFVGSFLVPETAHELIKGLFYEQTDNIGDQISKVKVRVKSIEMLPQIVLDSSSIRLKTTSPIVVSKKEISKTGKSRHKYLSPLDEAYEKHFFNNLLNKHRSALEHGLAKPITENPELSFRLLSKKPKMQGVIIKAYTPKETKVIGYQYEFQLIAPTELIRVGMLAGFGESNALGFGAVRKG